jgi:hypothetical protein
MIGLSLSSISKHNMWSYYDWVVVVVRQWTQYVVVLWLGCRHILCLLTDNNNDTPIIIRPHIAFTDGRQRQSNHNTTTYCVYWRKKTSSVSKHNMWSYYDWVVVVVRQWTQYVVVFWLGYRCCLPFVNIIFGDIMIGLSLLSSVSKFTDRRQQRQPNHDTTTYCVYWRKKTTIQS